MVQLKKRTRLYILILVVLCLVSCQEKVEQSELAVETSTEKSSLEEKEEGLQEAKVEMKEYRTSLQFYFQTPILVDGQLIAVSSNNTTDVEHPETIIYDIKTQTEENTKIPTQRLHLKGDNFYYFEHSLDLNVKPSLIKQHRTTGEKKVLYTVLGDHKWVLGIQHSDRYLSWHELRDSEDVLILSKDDVITATYYDLVVFDLEEEKEIYRIPSMLTYTPFTKARLFDNHLLLKSHLVDGKPRLSLVDFLEDKVVYEKEVEKTPFLLDYDHGLLAYSIYKDGLYVVDTSTNAVLYDAKGDFSDVYIVDGAYLVYGTNDYALIRDIKSNKLLFDSRENNPLYQEQYRFRYMASFFVDRQTKEIVLQKRDMTKQEGHSIVILRIK